MIILNLVLFSKLFIEQHKHHMMSQNSIKLRGSVIAILFTKIAKLSATSKRYADSGVIFNYIHSDVGQIIGISHFITDLIVGPFIFVGAIVLICQ